MNHFLWIFCLAAVFSLPAAEKLRVSAEPVSGNITAWKGYRRLFHSISGSPNNLVFGFDVPPLKTKYELNNPTFSVTVPPGIRLEEVLAQYLSLQTGQAVSYPLPMKAEKKSDGSLVCTFGEMKDFLEKSRQGTGNAVRKEITFYFEQEKFDPSREYKLTYRWSNGHEVSPECHVILKFLPPIDPPELPKRFRFHNMVNRLWNLDVGNPELQQRIMKKYESAGMASSGCLNVQYDSYEPVLRKAGWKFGQMLLWNPLTWRRSWCGEPIRPALLADGKEDPVYHCPMAALRNKALWDAVARRNFECEHIVDGDLLVIDNEPFGYMKHACFCPECLDEFALRYRLDRASLTPERIQKDYFRQWLDFHLKLQGKLLEKRVAEFRRRFPHSKVTIYNYLLDFDHPERLERQLYGCPLDPREADRFVDYHVPSIYTFSGKESIELIRRQKTYLKKPVGASISTDRALGMFGGYLSSVQASTPAGIRMKILLVAALGGPEVQNYCNRYHHDGYVFVNVAKALGEIAVLEDFYAEQQESTEAKASIDPAWNRKYADEFLSDSFEFIAKDWKNDTLLTLFNFGREFPIEAVAAYSGTLPSFYVSDPVRKIRYTCGSEPLWTSKTFGSSFRIRIQPEDAAFILISRTDPLLGIEGITLRDLRVSASGPGEENELEVRVAAEKQLLKEQFARKFSNCRHQTSSIDYDQSGILVNTPTQRVRLSYDSGLIAGWKKLPSGQEILPPAGTARYNYGEGSAWMIVNSPLRYSRSFQSLHIPFKPYDAAILDEGDVVVCLGYLASDFSLQKRFEISATASEIKVAFEFKNLTAGAMKTSLQTRICFSSPDILFSVDGKKVVTRTFNTYLFPSWDAGSLNSFKVDNHSCAGGIFNTPEASALLPGGRLILHWGMRDISRLLIYRDKSISTLELLTVEKNILPLHNFTFKTKMKVQ